MRRQPRLPLCYSYWPCLVNIFLVFFVSPITISVSVAGLKHTNSGWRGKCSTTVLQPFAVSVCLFYIAWGFYSVRGWTQTQNLKMSRHLLPLCYSRVYLTFFLPFSISPLVCEHCLLVSLVWQWLDMNPLPLDEESSVWPLCYRMLLCPFSFQWHF